MGGVKSPKGTVLFGHEQPSGNAQKEPSLLGKEPSPSGIRRFIVDTDTGSDDVWAIIEALRATAEVRVEAVTVVCGNFPLDLCVKNAMLAVEAAETYLPPVYRGCEWPLAEKRIFCADYVHGEDGLGGMNLPTSERPLEKTHAVDAIRALAEQYAGEIELVTCGPLTNIATALSQDPSLAKKIRHAWILGGAAGDRGNLKGGVEYNVGSDPEAAAIVLASGMPATWVTWDNARGETEITPAEAERLAAGSPAARFCARCAKSLTAYYQQKYGRESFGVIDSCVMTVALYPKIIGTSFAAYCEVETEQSGKAERGAFRIDREKAPNAELVTRIDAAAYKEKLFALLGAAN